MNTIQINELKLNDVIELTSTELETTNGGDSLAHDIGETVGYFFGYLYTAGPRMITLLL